MSIKDLIEFLETIDKNKNIFIDSCYDEIINSSLISEFEIDDVIIYKTDENKGYIVLGINFNNYSSDYVLRNTKDEISDIITGITVDKLIDILKKFNNKVNIYFASNNNKNPYGYIVDMKKEYIHNWKENILISDYYNKNMENTYQPLFFIRSKN